MGEVRGMCARCGCWRSGHKRCTRRRGVPRVHQDRSYGPWGERQTHRAKDLGHWHHWVTGYPHTTFRAQSVNQRLSVCSHVAPETRGGSAYELFGLMFSF